MRYARPLTRRGSLIRQSLEVGTQIHTAPPAFNEQNLDVKDIIQGIYDRASKMYGTNEQPNL
jgi:hypothetical protein